MAWKSTRNFNYLHERLGTRSFVNLFTREIRKISFVVHFIRRTHPSRSGIVLRSPPFPFSPFLYPVRNIIRYEVFVIPIQLLSSRRFATSMSVPLCSRVHCGFRFFRCYRPFSALSAVGYRLWIFPDGKRCRASVLRVEVNWKYIFQCECCKLENDDAIPSTLPDLSIIYKLHLESRKLINMYDWLQVTIRSCLCLQVNHGYTYGHVRVPPFRDFNRCTPSDSRDHPFANRPPKGRERVVLFFPGH